MAPIAGDSVNLSIWANAGLTYTLEYASNLTSATQWFPLAVTNATVSPFNILDAHPSGRHRWYRVKQP